MHNLKSKYRTDSNCMYDLVVAEQTLCLNSCEKEEIWVLGTPLAPFCCCWEILLHVQFFDHFLRSSRHCDPKLIIQSGNSTPLGHQAKALAKQEGLKFVRT